MTNIISKITISDHFIQLMFKFCELNRLICSKSGTHLTSDRALMSSAFFFYRAPSFFFFSWTYFFLKRCTPGVGQSNSIKHNGLNGYHLNLPSNWKFQTVTENSKILTNQIAIVCYSEAIVKHSECNLHVLTKRVPNTLGARNITS